MENIRSHNGWVRLDNGFDVEFFHGIPRILSDNGRSDSIDDATLVEKLTDLSGLKTNILGWHQGEERGEHEAALRVDATQFEEVLKRLALASAALFVERYRSPINKGSVDWDKEEYDLDFNRALEHCCLGPTACNKNEFFDIYRQCMHEESNRLVNEHISPTVQAE